MMYPTGARRHIGDCVAFGVKFRYTSNETKMLFKIQN